MCVAGVFSLAFITVREGLRRRSFRFAILAVSCLLFSGCVPLRQPEEPTGPHFGILTYNVNFAQLGPGLAVKAIEQSNADIVCLQETTAAWERFLQPRLKARFAHMRFRHYPPGGGMAVFSRWPFEEVAFVPPKEGWWPGWVVNLHTPVGPVQLLHVHLRPSLSERGRFSLGSYYSTKRVRLREIQDLYTYLNPDLPTIVLGDFNEGDSGSAVRWLKKGGMIDALREFDRRTSTWRWRTTLITVRGRLDHILYSEHLYCLAARVVEGGGSDHSPVWAMFESAPQRQSALTRERAPLPKESQREVRTPP